MTISRTAVPVGTAVSIFQTFSYAGKVSDDLTRDHQPRRRRHKGRAARRRAALDALGLAALLPDGRNLLGINDLQMRVSERSAIRRALGSSLLPVPMLHRIGTPASRQRSTSAILALTVSMASIT